MAAGGGSKKANNNDQDSNKHNQKLQAVLLADSFLTTFQPITLDKTTPKVLCPLNNVTMLDYSIEYLAGAGVQELYIFCVSGGDAIETFIQQKSSASWKTTSSMKIQCVRDSSVTDAGGALREMYNRNLIRSNPFILMSGDVVTNADIGLAMKEHKERHKKDDSAIMTVLLKRVGGWNVNLNANANDNATSNGNANATSNGNANANAASNINANTNTNTNINNNTNVVNSNGSSQHAGSSSKTNQVVSSCRVSHLQSLNEDLTVALAHPSPSSPYTHSRLFLYDTNPNSTTTHLPTSFFQSASSIELFNNMIDCGLYICSPDVLAKFSDEWDYLHIKTFISNSVAEEEEGLQTKIYAKQLTSSEYAAKITDFRTYHAVSNDLLKRWCYPIVPDNLPCGYEKIYRYGVERHMMYIEQKGKTKVGKRVMLKGPGMVGCHTKIDDDCVVLETVIGNECFIGKNVSLTRCHLWDKVLVEEGASVNQSILCIGCTVKKGAVVNKGCVIGKNCIIGENVVLPEFTRISANVLEEDDMFGGDNDDNDDDDDDDNTSDTSEDEITDHDVVGKDGFGNVWAPNKNEDDIDDDSEEEEEEEWNALEQMKAQSIGYDPTAMLQKRMKRQIEKDVMNVDHGLDDEEDENESNQDISFSNLDEVGLLIAGRQADVDVVKEFKSICLDFDLSSPIENLRIELNSFKFSQNATFSDCVRGVTLAILDRLQLTDGISAVKLLASFKTEVQAWAELLKKMCFGQEEEVSVIKAIETAAISDGTIGNVLCREPSFRFILQTLHAEEIVSDEAVLKWANERRDGIQDSPVGKLFNQKHTQEFLEWIQEDSSSGSDDSDSDSDGSSD